MLQHPDSGQTSSPLPFRSHTALLLSAALPFLQPAYRHPVELITKFLEFSETIKLYQEFHAKNGNPFAGLFQDVAQSGREGGVFGLINTFIMDIEGLLQSLSQVCTGDEKEIISMFLNLIRAKNFYETYGDLLNMGSLFSSGSGADSFFSGGTSPFAEQNTGESFCSEANDTPGTEEPPIADSVAPSPAPAGFPFSGDLSSMLSDDQKETLDLLKSLFAQD